MTRLATPVVFHKGELVAVAETVGYYVQLVYDGWTAGSPLPTPPLFSAAQQAAILAVARADATATYALARTAVQSTAYTADAGQLVPVDTTSGPVTITLPTAPVDGAQIGVKHILQGTSNAVTVALGGTDVLNKAGGSTSYSLPYVNQAVLLKYDAASHIWSVVADDLPKSALDGLYGPGSTAWLQQVGAAFGFAFTAITTTDATTGLPTAATVRWPDGTTGAFTGTIDGAGNGYTGYTAAWGPKTLTASGITYNATTGVALGPTGLVVA